MKTIFFVAGTKGGVGKSTFSQYLANAAEDSDIPVRLYDSDSENMTLKHLRPDAVFLDDAKESYPLDQVVNDAIEDDGDRIYIVDMKAGTTRSAQQWFQEIPWDILDENDVHVYIVGCLTSDPDSVRTYVQWISYFTEHNEAKVRMLAVKNEKDGLNFSAFESMIEPAFFKQDYPIFTFRAMDKAYQADLNNAGVQLRDVAQGAAEIPGRKGKMEQSRYKRYYDGYTHPLAEFLNQLGE